VQSFLLLLLHDTNRGNARQSFFDEFQTQVPAHRETREARPEVSTGRCTRYPTAHGETRERRIYPEVSTGRVFSKIDDCYRLQPKIYRLRFMVLERESVRPSGTPGQASLQFTYLLTIYTCKGNMTFIIYRKILRTIFMGKILFKGFYFFSLMIKNFILEFFKNNIILNMALIIIEYESRCHACTWFHT